MGETKHQIVVLSDLHIGTGGPTVWYQRSVHDAHLKCICDWVVANASTIREVVLLGDVVDFWTQPCDTRPPSFGEVLAANPQIFGPAGFFGRVLDALDGNVTYVPGNHDMTVQAADVVNIVSPAGHRMRFASGTYLPMGPDDNSVALAHGNQFTLFNAPDNASPWNGLPVGHFVTRMIASEWERRLTPGKNVASLPNQGSPDGLDYYGIVWNMFERRDASVTQALLSSVADQTGTPPDQKFVLADGSVTTLAQVKQQYDGLFTRWAQAEGGGSLGDLIAWKSVLADARGTYMAWFAQREAFSRGAQVIVLGHTHIPQLGMDTTMVKYANTGFACPSAPDMPPQAVTFVVVDTNTSDVAMFHTSADATQIQDFQGQPASPVPIGTDDSCYVQIDNSSSSDLTLAGSSADSGNFVGRIPTTIPAGTTGMVWLQDRAGEGGSEGSVTYAAPKASHKFSFSCPFSRFYSNACAGGSSFRTKSGHSSWSSPGHVETSGSPFYVQFSVTD